MENHQTIEYSPAFFDVIGGKSKFGGISSDFLRLHSGSKQQQKLHAIDECDRMN
jgi:hypothetical protein